MYIQVHMYTNQKRKSNTCIDDEEEQGTHLS